MNLNLAVKNLGLNDKEAQIYLALLQLGKTTAYSVSVKSGIKKPTTYVILDNLEEKGFAVKFSQDKKQLFQAEAPQKCIEKVKEQLTFTEEALPELLAIKKEGSEKPSVSYYEGIEGIKKMYEKTLEKAQKGEAIGYFGRTDSEISKEFINCWNEYNKKRLEKGIKARGIISNHPENKRFLDNAKRLVFKLKTIPSEKYDGDISIETIGNFVQIISFQKSRGILIDNPDVAKAVKQIFEMNWDLLEVNKKVVMTKKEKETGQGEGEEIKPDEEIDIKINRIVEV